MPGMLDAVDAVIHQARTLLGTGQPATPAPPITGGTPPSMPHQWAGPAADNAQTTSTRLHHHRQRLSSAHADATTAMVNGTHIATDAHRNLDIIEADWTADKNTLGRYADTPEGQAALTQAGMRRITETHSLVFGTAKQYGDASHQVHNAANNLPDTEDHPTDPNTPTDPDDPTADPTETDDDSDNTPTTASNDPAQPPSTLTQPQLGPNTARPPLAAMTMPQAMPMSGAMPSSAGAGMSGGSGLSSLLQPLTQAISAATSAAADPHDDHDTDHDVNDSDPSTGSSVVDNAARALGQNYVWGGGGPNGPSGGGFDCSGLAQFAVAQATGGHVILPRTTYDQIHVGQTVDPRDARPGDLIFSNFSAPGVPEHVQIYAGGGRVIEAQQDGVPVKYSPAPTSSVVIKRVV